MSIVCPVCGTPTKQVIASKLRRGTGTVYRCGPCDLGFLVGTSDPERYEGAYREEVSHKAEGGPTTPREVFETYRRYQTDRLRMVEPFIGPKKKVVEYGAGAGQFAHHLKDRCERVVAIEPDVASRKFMKDELGLLARTSRMATGSRPEKFDVACAFQVLEHVDDPVAFLTEIRSGLREGGVAVIEVPNLYDPLRAVWGIEEYEEFYFHADHRFYFSDRALRIVAAKAGFKECRTVNFTQDYKLLNHLSWLVNRKPQADCHIGMAPVMIQEARSPIAKWLLDKLAKLEALYVADLMASGQTANIAMVLTT